LTGYSNVAWVAQHLEVDVCTRGRGGLQPSGCLRQQRMRRQGTRSPDEQRSQQKPCTRDRYQTTQKQSLGYGRTLSSVILLAGLTPHESIGCRWS
jgi:hypothetical protein